MKCGTSLANARVLSLTGLQSVDEAGALEPKWKLWNQRPYHGTDSCPPGKNRSPTAKSPRRRQICSGAQGLVADGAFLLQIAWEFPKLGDSNLDTTDPQFAETAILCMLDRCCSSLLVDLNAFHSCGFGGKSGVFMLQH